MEECATALSVAEGGIPAPFDPRSWLAAIVDTSDDAIVSKTLEGIVVTWNGGAERIFGYTAAEMVGQSINRLIPSDRLGEEPMILARIAAGERVDHFETVRRRKDGELIDVSVTISPVRDAAGRIVGASKIARDVSQAHRLQTELAAAKLAAESANAAKDRFLSVLSHELRNPLTPALLAASLIEQDADVQGELRHEMALIRRNLECQARIIDDLLDLARIARGTLSLQFGIIDAHQAIRNVVAMLENQVRAKSQRVRLDLQAPHFNAWVDAGRFQQIVLNLLLNAVKFTPEFGTITIATQSRDGRFHLEFTDTGIGIEPEALACLFHPFEHGDAGVGLQFGGLGLGLSIVKSLVTAQSGEISAESAGKGAGAVFRLSFPLAPDRGAATDPSPHAAAPSPVCRRVLVVDDHADTREMMAHLVRRLGCNVVAAGSAREATELLKRESVDLLICDLGLTDGTGADVIAAMRGSGAFRAIAVTGYGQKDDLIRSREAGFQLHLTKPINATALRQAVIAMTDLTAA